MKQRGNRPIPLNVSGKENTLWLENQRLQASLDRVKAKCDEWEDYLVDTIPIHIVRAAIEGEKES